MTAITCPPCPTLPIAHSHQPIGEHVFTTSAYPHSPCTHSLLHSVICTQFSYYSSISLCPFPNSRVTSLPVSPHCRYHVCMQLIPSVHRPTVHSSRLPPSPPRRYQLQYPNTTAVQIHITSGIRRTKFSPPACLDLIPQPVPMLPNCGLTFTLS